MKTESDVQTAQYSIDSGRRELLAGAGAGAVALTMGGVLAGTSGTARAQPSRPLRWGIVGTGGIAGAMAPMIKMALNADLAAVSSRKMETAGSFAQQHGIGKAFDSWADMFAWDGVDAVYVATPTSVREEISVAAANSGKHVLAEKPFANLPSVKRITAVCRDNGVGFMDGTHFVHEPRTAQIRATMSDRVGWPWSVASAFQFRLTDKSNIRMRPDLEPYGAIGDTGWYNMRAAVEYLSAGVELKSVDAYLRRDAETGAVVSCSGVIVFNDGATTTFNCGFESGSGVMDLRISGAKGVIKLDDFLRARPPGQPASYEYRTGWGGEPEIVEVPGIKPGAALMFEDFSAMIGDPQWLAASMAASERTQLLLDAVWESATGNEA